MTNEEILRRAGVTREELGRNVREHWINWASTQPDVADHPGWLVLYDNLAPEQQEADMRIGEELFCLGWEARRP